MPLSQERSPLLLGARLWVISLPLHPFPDIWRTLQDRYARSFTFVQESDAVDIDQLDLLQIQGYWLSSTPYFRFHLAKVLNPKLTAKTDAHISITKSPLDLQCHKRLSLETHVPHCNRHTICN